MEATTLRKRTSLQETIIKTINEQIEVEAHSSSEYLAMSAWCHVQGYVGAGKFFKKQSEEERVHMFKLYDYLIDMGAHPFSPEVKNITIHFSDLKMILDQFLSMEINITDRFNKISKKCFEASDMQTFSFVQWFLDEQKEEEDVARRTLEIYDLIGTELDGLYKIDHAIGEMAE